MSTEPIQGEVIDENAVRCPRCGSTSVSLANKGYDYGCGCCGAAILGWPGLLCGLLDANNKHKECMKCGYKWK